MSSLQNPEWNKMRKNLNLLCVMEIDTDVLELDLDYILLLTPAYYYLLYLKL